MIPPTPAGAVTAAILSAAGFACFGAWVAAGAGVEVCVAGAEVGAGDWIACSAAPPIPIRRSSLSMRASEPTSVWSLEGTSTLAHINSRCSFGEVAPDISVSAVFTVSAAWVSSANPKTSA